MSEEEVVNDAPVTESETPAEQVAQAEESVNAEKSAEAESTTAEAPEGDGDQKPKSKAEKRIDRLTWEKNEALRQVDRLKQQLSEPASDVPREGDFETYEDFVVAKAAHSMEMKQRQQREAELAAHQQAIQSQRRHQFNQQVQDAQARYDDFNEVAFNPSVPISNVVAELLTTSDKGADLAYHLGSHPEVAAQLAQMEPMRAAIEIGKIEARLNLPKPKTVTSAPEPIKPIGGIGDSAAVDPSKMTTEEFITWRYQQLNGS